MEIRTFFSELKRRKVFRVAAVYAAVAFVVVQAADIVFPALHLPGWTLTFVVLLALLGFPIALVLAWAFEVTPEGVRRTEPLATTSGSAEARQPWALFAGGVVVAALVGAGLGGWYLRPGEAGDGIRAAAASIAPDEARVDRSIAVLPFVNLSPDPEQEYFSDGITEDLITNLSRIEELRVISRSSVMRYKGSELAAAQIAGELRVGHVLEGSVRREGNQVRINVQLIDPARDSPLWAARYDRELTSIFEIQGELAQRIAEALEQRLSPEDRTRIAAGGTEDLAAYELLLRGREYLNRPGAGDLRKYPLAMGFFRQALEVDPGYARAYVGLSQVFRRNVALPTIPVRRDSILFYARRAVDLDPELAEAATELAYGHLFAGDRARAEAEFQRALALDANQADAMEGMARLAVLGGRLDEAVRWQRRAVAVDPLAAPRLTSLGSYLFDLGDLRGAGERFARAVALAPDLPEASFLLALIHLLRGEEEQAEARMRALQAVAADNPGVHVGMGRYQIQRGHYRAAQAQLEHSPAAESPAIRAYLAFIALRLGDRERAARLFRPTDELLASWEAAGLSIPPRGQLHRHVLRGDREGMLATVRQHWRSGLRWIEDPLEIGVYWLDLDPMLADLRDDPRFQTLLREMRAELDAMRARLEE
jgi:TolB-like protein/Flp pilus assembly protein TadD